MRVQYLPGFLEQQHIEPGVGLPFSSRTGRPRQEKRVRAPGRAPEGTTSRSTRARFAAATAVLTILALAAASAPAADPPAPAPAAAVAAPILTDPFTETRELRRASRTTRAAAATTAPATTAVPEATRARVATPAKKPKKATTAKAAAPAPRKRRTQAATATPVAAAADGSRASVVTGFALAQVGKPYIWASSGPRGYDCSGLMKAAFARVGIALPHQSGEIAGRGRAVPRGQWAPGDVLVWRGHVALYLGGGKVVHAPGRGRSITVASVWGSPTARRLL